MTTTSDQEKTMPETVPVTVLAGDRTVQTQVSPAWLYEHYRLLILAGRGSNIPKIERAKAYIAEARADGTFTPEQADRLERLADHAIWETENPQEGDGDDEQ